MRQRSAHQPDSAHQGQLVCPVPALERGGLEGARRRSAGVDDQNVQAPELPDRRLEKRIDIGVPGNVGGGPARGRDGDSGGLDGFCVAGGDVDLGALTDEGFGASPPEPLARGGDQRAPVLQPEIHGNSVPPGIGQMPHRYLDCFEPRGRWSRWVGMLTRLIRTARPGRRDWCCETCRTAALRHDHSATLEVDMVGGDVTLSAGAADSDPLSGGVHVPVRHVLESV